MEEAEENFKNIDALFLALPHGLSEKITKKALENDVKVFDLGADFRLDDSKIYVKWYKVNIIIQKSIKMQFTGFQKFIRKN